MRTIIVGRKTYEVNTAIILCKRAFGCKVKSLLHNSDAVKNGWAEPNESIDNLVYHSEIMFDKHEVRMADSFDEAKVDLTKAFTHIVGFDTLVYNSFCKLG